ncbi:MAG: GTPase ObgE [Planctomycetaceae bacterium]
MFVDRVEIICKGGDGGHGCMSMRREAHVPYGGPDGGDGGRGGHVIIQADRNIGSLTNLLGHKHWRADGGKPGQGALKHGKKGEDIIIYVPPGTLVRDIERDVELRDLVEQGESIIIARGGRGGHGNKHFATATNRTPRDHELGKPGQERRIALELKLIADVGLIGKPNAGKSTLLSRLSRATPEIADYPFTTKYPNLGMVRVGYDQQFVMADIPGLIEGAHSGIGLGHEFLRHVQRTKILVHLIEPAPLDQTDPIENYHQIHEELRLYDPTLIERPEIIVVTKCELPDAEAAIELLQEDLGKPVLAISAVTGKGLPQLIQKIWQILESLGEPAAQEEQVMDNG